MIRMPSVVHHHPTLLVATKGAVIMLMLFGIVLMMPIAFPLLAMVALYSLPVD